MWFATRVPSICMAPGISLAARESCSAHQIVRGSHADVFSSNLLSAKAVETRPSCPHPLHTLHGEADVVTRQAMSGLGSDVLGMASEVVELPSDGKGDVGS